MKTLDEFLDEIENNLNRSDWDEMDRDGWSCEALPKAVKIIREMKEAIDELDIPMSMKITSTHRKHLTYQIIYKILNEWDGK